MIAFSIMMFFITFVLLCVSISLLMGNVSGVHGKVFEETNDKVGYAKSSGKAVLCMAIGLLISGVVPFLPVTKDNISVSVAIILIVIVIVGFWFYKIQKKFKH